MNCIRASKASPVLFLLVSLTFSPNAFANGATVGRAGAVGTFDYASLQAALDALHAISNGNNLIAVSACTEIAAREMRGLRYLGRQS